MRAVHASEPHGLAREVAEAVVTDMADHAHGGTARAAAVAWLAPLPPAATS